MLLGLAWGIWLAFVFYHAVTFSIRPTVRGTVVSAQRPYLQSRDVWLGGPAQNEFYVQADINGNFSFSHVAPGAYELRWQDQRRSFEVPAGAVVDLGPIESAWAKADQGWYIFLAAISLGFSLVFMVFGLAGFWVAPSKSLALAFWLLCLTPVVRYVVLMGEILGSLNGAEHLSLSFFTWELGGVVFLGAAFFHYFSVGQGWPQQRWFKYFYGVPCCVPVLIYILGHFISSSNHHVIERL